MRSKTVIITLLLLLLLLLITAYQLLLGDFLGRYFVTPFCSVSAWCFIREKYDGQQMDLKFRHCMHVASASSQTLNFCNFLLLFFYLKSYEIFKHLEVG